MQICKSDFRNAFEFKIQQAWVNISILNAGGKQEFPQKSQSEACP